MDYDPINWYQRPRSALGEVRCANVDPSLPPPWKEVIDGATGRFYYWNTETNATQFDKPAYQVPFPSFYPFPYPEPVPMGNTSVPPAATLFEPPPQPPHFSPPSFPTSHQTQPLALPVPVVHDLLNQIAAIQQTIAEFSNTRAESLRQFQEHRRQFQELRSQWPCRTTSAPVTSSVASVHSFPQPYPTDDNQGIKIPVTHPYPNPKHQSNKPPVNPSQFDAGESIVSASLSSYKAPVPSQCTLPSRTKALKFIWAKRTLKPRLHVKMKRKPFPPAARRRQTRIRGESQLTWCALPLTTLAKVDESSELDVLVETSPASVPVLVASLVTANPDFRVPVIENEPQVVESVQLLVSDDLDAAKVMPSNSDGSRGLESILASNAVLLLPVPVVVESLEPDAVHKHGSNVDGFILDEDYPCPVSNIPLQITLHDEFSRDELAPVSLCHSEKARKVVYEATKFSFASTTIADSHGLLDSDSWEDVLSTGHLRDQMQPVLLERQVASFPLDFAGERVVDVPDDLTRAWGKTLPLGALITSDQYGSSDSKTVAAIMIIATEMGENSNDGDESLSLMDKWQHNWVQDTGGGTQFLFGAPSITAIFPQPLIDKVFCRRSLGILNVGYRKLLLEFDFGLRPGGYFLQPATSISHKFQGVAAMKVTYNDRAPNQPPPCYECSMRVWNYSEKTIGCVPQVTQLQLVQELLKIGVLPSVLCNQIISDFGKAEYRHIGIYISIAWERCAQMDGRESSADHSDIIVNYSHSRPRDGYFGSLWPYSLFCLARMGLLSLCQEVPTHRIGQKRLLKQFVVMFVNKNAKCVAWGSITREICEVEARQTAHDLIAIRNHISFQGMMSLLHVTSAVAFAKFHLHVILMVCLQGDGNPIIVNTLHTALLSCHGQLQDASFLFSSGLNDSLQVNSALSSLSYSCTLTVLIAGDIHSVVHLTSQAWLLLLQRHERGLAGNIAPPNSPSLLVVARLFPWKFVLEISPPLVFGAASFVFATVIPATKLIPWNPYVALLLLPMHNAERLLPFPTVEFMGHYMMKDEMVAFWIWLPTSLLQYQVWVFSLHDLIVITAQILIGDKCLIGELLFAYVSAIITTGSIVIILGCHSGLDLYVTIPYSHMSYYYMYWLHTVMKQYVDYGVTTDKWEQYVDGADVTTEQPRDTMMWKAVNMAIQSLSLIIAKFDVRIENIVIPLSSAWRLQIFQLWPSSMRPRGNTYLSAVFVLHFLEVSKTDVVHIDCVPCLFQNRDEMLKVDFMGLSNFRQDTVDPAKRFAGKLASSGAAGAPLFFVYSLDYNRTHLTSDFKAANATDRRASQFTSSAIVYKKPLNSVGIAGIHRGLHISCNEAVEVAQAIQELRMDSTEVSGTAFDFLICSSHEDMPYLKGGGMLGLICHTYIWAWVTLSIHLGGLLGLYKWVSGLGSVHLI